MHPLPGKPHGKNIIFLVFLFSIRLFFFLLVKGGGGGHSRNVLFEYFWNHIDIIPLSEMWFWCRTLCWGAWNGPSTTTENWFPGSRSGPEDGRVQIWDLEVSKVNFQSTYFLYLFTLERRILRLLPSLWNYCSWCSFFMLLVKSISISMGPREGMEGQYSCGVWKTMNYHFWFELILLKWQLYDNYTYFNTYPNGFPLPKECVE